MHSEATSPVLADHYVVINDIYRHAAHIDETTPYAQQLGYINIGPSYGHFDGHGGTITGACAAMPLFFVFRQILLLHALPALHSEAATPVLSDDSVVINDIYRHAAHIDETRPYAQQLGYINIGSSYGHFDGHGGTTTGACATMPLFFVFRQILLLHAQPAMHSEATTPVLADDYVVINDMYRHAAHIDETRPYAQQLGYVNIGPSYGHFDRHGGRITGACAAMPLFFVFRQALL